jgi:hypothetical protein
MGRALIVCRILLLTVFATILSAPAMGQDQNHDKDKATLEDQTFAKGENPYAKDRFEFWFAHVNKDQIAHENEWQLHVDWSIQDHGFVEPEIQKEWVKLGIYHECLWAPGAEGRKTAMKIAIQDAKAGHCDKAGLITVTTQLHNPEAIDTFRKTDPKELCKYLKGK